MSEDEKKIEQEVKSSPIPAEGDMEELKQAVKDLTSDPEDPPHEQSENPPPGPSGPDPELKEEEFKSESQDAGPGDVDGGAMQQEQAPEDTDQKSNYEKSDE